MANAPPFTGTLHEWQEGVKTGFTCLFSPASDSVRDQGHCNLSLMYGLVFTLTYCMSYIFGSLLFRYSSANFNALITSLGNPLATIYWFVFPAAASYVGNGSMSQRTVHFTAASLPVILIGAIFFRRFEVLPEHKATIGATPHAATSAINDDDAHSRLPLLSGEA